MRSFEYKMATSEQWWDRQGLVGTVEYLNELGSQGWELVSVWQHTWGPEYSRFLLKREILKP